MDYFVLFSLALMLFLEKNITSAEEGLSISDLSQCKHQIEPIGCYNDDRGDRVFPEPIINSRDTGSSVFMPPKLVWKVYPSFLSNFICECAKRVIDGNHGDYFGIQYYGECWSSNSSTVGNFSRYGTENAKCFDSEFKEYTESKRCGLYTGDEWSNFVYRVKPYSKEKSCSEYFESIGCYRDNQIAPRPLPKYLANERDITLPNWNGYMIDWNNWDTYMPDLICRCAMVAKSKFYRYFGLQFYGECWGGNDTMSFSKDGNGEPGDCLVKLGTDPHCEICPSIEEQNKTKGCKAQLCVGKQQVNYVYELKQGPLGCASSPCATGQICKANGSNLYECINA